jgi:hypothetical protein
MNPRNGIDLWGFLAQTTTTRSATAAATHPVGQQHEVTEETAPGLGGGRPGAALTLGLERWGNAKPELILRAGRQCDVRWRGTKVLGPRVSGRN